MRAVVNIENLIDCGAHLTCLGWTGRDPSKRDAHVAELVALGVPIPLQMPISVELSPLLVTNNPDISVVGTHTSGEVEFVIIKNEKRFGDDLLVTVGSDHTDRELECLSIPLSKQVCAKCVSSQAWFIDDVIEHWDRLILRSWVVKEGGKNLYQQGEAKEIIHPDILWKKLSVPSHQQPAFLFCGTLPTINGIVFGDGYEIEIMDPILDRVIRHSYSVRLLQQQL